MNNEYFKEHTDIKTACSLKQAKFIE